MGLHACSRQDYLSEYLQKEGVDLFKTYAPVAYRTTIRILLTLILQEEWFTRQVNFENAFAQTELTETGFIEHSKCFAPKSGKDLILKLLKSLYGQNKRQELSLKSQDQVCLNMD